MDDMGMKMEKAEELNKSIRAQQQELVQCLKEAIYLKVEDDFVTLCERGLEFEFTVGWYKNENGVTRYHVPAHWYGERLEDMLQWLEQYQPLFEQSMQRGIVYTFRHKYAPLQSKSINDAGS